MGGGRVVVGVRCGVAGGMQMMGGQMIKGELLADWDNDVVQKNRLDGEVVLVEISLCRWNILSTIAQKNTGLKGIK